MRRKIFSPSNFFVPGFTLLFGLVLIVLAIMRGIETESFVHRAKPVTGTVLASRQGILIWSAVVTVAFRDSQGVDRTAEFETGSGTTALGKGDTLDLLYDPTDTSYVYYKNPRYRRHPVAGLFFILGCCLIFFTLRHFREGAPGTKA